MISKMCFKCKRDDKLTKDHHYPLSAGNALTVKNAVLLCQSCNSSKGDKLPEDFYTKKELKNINMIFKKISGINTI